VRRLFEWGVATERAGERRLSPVGITDEEPRARARMLEALREVPDDVPARGWVTVVRYVPGLNTYDRYHTPVRAERAGGGTVRMLVDSSGD
jgi:hypothetical protein